MRFWISLVFLVMSGCTATVVRDATVYQAELDFLEQAAFQPSDQLEKMLRAHCTCMGGNFTTQDCENAAHKILVVRTRVPWHKAMMLYNAGLLDTRPPKEPPIVPETKTLCP